MNVLICFAAICIAFAYCDVIDNSYGHDKAYGSEKEYEKEQEYPYENKEKSHGDHDDDYSNKKAYGSETEYGKEKQYGHASHDKSYEHGDYGHGDHGHNNYGLGVAYNKQFVYHGKYNGHCGKDGFYYRDDSSFVICSNNNAYVQPCAPGSRNSGHDDYNYGDNYNYRDFCDVNLVDHGYGVKGKYDHHDDQHKSYRADEHNSRPYKPYNRKSFDNGYGYSRFDGHFFGRWP